MFRIGLFVVLSLFFGNRTVAQQVPMPKNGPNDTILVTGIFYDGEWMPSARMEEVIVSNLSPEKLAQYLQEYNRLKRAVYTTLPYAQAAGGIINDVNAHLKGVSSKKDRKKYIKSREAELKKQFADPLSNLSVYQGKVLMKLIYRETGNDCYEIIKEYKGGLNARMYQTVAFFFGGDLRQEFDPSANTTDKQIEHILQELNYYWANQPHSAAAGNNKILGQN
jgi:hypothetical protein